MNIFVAVVVGLIGIAILCAFGAAALTVIGALLGGTATGI